MQKETKCKNEVFSVFFFSLPQTKSSRRTQRCCRGGGMQIGPLPRRLHFISRKKKHSSFFLFSCFLLLLLDAGLQKNAAERQHKKSGNIFLFFRPSTIVQWKPLFLTCQLENRRRRSSDIWSRKINICNRLYLYFCTRETVRWLVLESRRTLFIIRTPFFSLKQKIYASDTCCCSVYSSQKQPTVRAAVNQHWKRRGREIYFPINERWGPNK